MVVNESNHSMLGTPPVKKCALSDNSRVNTHLASPAPSIPETSLTAHFTKPTPWRMGGLKGERCAVELIAYFAILLFKNSRYLNAGCGDMLGRHGRR